MLQQPVCTPEHLDSLLANLPAHLRVDSNGVVVHEKDYERMIGSDPDTPFVDVQISAAVYSANVAFGCSVPVTRRVTLSSEEQAPPVPQCPSSIEPLAAVWKHELRFAVLSTTTMAVGQKLQGIPDRYLDVVSVWWLHDSTGLMQQHVLNAKLHGIDHGSFAIRRWRGSDVDDPIDGHYQYFGQVDLEHVG